MKAKKGVLLLNLGTPDSTKTSDVRKYLREFLSDRRVIDINSVGRWFLVNMIIAPFRSPKSAEEYRKLWTDRGSPLYYYGLDLKKALQEKLSDDYTVEFGMRYQNPSIEKALETFKNKGYEEITIIPLYPQYASATTGSTIEKVNEIINTWEIIPSLRFISNFVEHPLFIKAFAEIGKKHLDKKQYDKLVFSFHGLPERQILKGSTDNYCKLGECCSKYHAKNRFCYRAQCFETARRIAEELNIPEKDYTVCFQSRLGRAEWIKPYIDDTYKELIEQGNKRVLVFSPAFVSDCLETTIEIGEAYKEQFEEAGGEEWQLVESLNVHPTWVACLEDLVRS